MPPKKSANKGKPGGRAGNIGGMVSTTAADIFRLFSYLPHGARRDVLDTLTRMSRPLAEGGLPPSGPAGIPADPPANAGGRGREGNNSPPTAEVRKERGFDKPIVRDLEAARLLREMTPGDRNSDLGQRYNTVVSVALAAIARAREQSIPEADQHRLITASGGDLAVLRGLWPRPVRREQAAEEAAGPPEAQPQEEPTQIVLAAVGRDDDDELHHSETNDEEEIFTATPGSVLHLEGGDVFITSHTLDVGGDSTQNTLITPEPEIAERILQLGGGHVISETPRSAIHMFLRGERRNYLFLSNYLRIRSSDNRVIFYGVPRERESNPRPRKRGKKSRKNK